MKSVISAHCSLGQVDARGFRLITRLAQRRACGRPGLERPSSLAAGRLDEIVERCELELPAEAADTAITEPGHPATDFRVARAVKTDQPWRRWSVHAGGR